VKRCLTRSPVKVALKVAPAAQVWGSSQVPDAIAAEELGTLTRLRDLKDLELNQCGAPVVALPPLTQQPGAALNLHVACCCSVLSAQRRMHAWHACMPQQLACP
jgi:hypothetical protein